MVVVVVVFRDGVLDLFLTNHFDWWSLSPWVAESRIGEESGVVVPRSLKRPRTRNGGFRSSTPPLGSPHMT